MLVLSSRLRYPVEKLFFSEQFSTSTVKFSCCCEVLAWFFVLPSVILVKSCSCKNNSRVLSSIGHVFHRYFKVSISYLFLHFILSLRHAFWVNFSYRFFLFSVPNCVCILLICHYPAGPIAPVLIVFLSFSDTITLKTFRPLLVSCTLFFSQF